MHKTNRWLLPLCTSRSLIHACVALCASSGTASAHNFASGQGAYEDFLSGNQAVLVDLPIILGLMATGILVGNWSKDRLPKVWLSFIVGAMLGLVVGLLGVLPPTLPTYVAVCVIGLLGAAAPALSILAMRVIVGLAGAILGNAVLSGHTVEEVQALSYLGILFALNLGLAASAGVVTISREKLPYGWVAITWRALSSWLVAISIMAMVLSLRASGS